VEWRAPPRRRERPPPTHATDLYDTTCGLVRPATVINTTAAPPTVPGNPATWHAEPAKVFDNLYFVGQSEYSAWAVTTSDGIILMDAIFDYSVDDEVVGGLKRLGLDPARIKCVIVSHAHGDHVGGARFLQDRGAHVVMSAADWDLLDRSTVNFAKPKRDIATRAGADVVLSNHTKYDNTPQKLAALRSRGVGAPHPYVIGKTAVQRFFTVAEECALGGAASVAP
jgi:L-ascorbate metabolism protein UlaG (beta-lactamase superfamily)